MRTIRDGRLFEVWSPTGVAFPPEGPKRGELWYAAEVMREPDPPRVSVPFGSGATPDEAIEALVEGESR